MTHDHQAVAGPSRRTVVAAGIWAVPVIATATATPAFAASGDAQINASMSLWAVTHWDSSGQGGTVLDGLQGTMHIQETWASPAIVITSLTLLISVPKEGMRGQAPTVMSGAGWTAGNGTTSGNSISYTFTWSGSMSTTTPGQTSLNFTLPGKGTKLQAGWFPKSVTATLTGSRTSGASAQVTVAAPQ